MGEERLPKNLQGLLRFAMQYTKAEDAPNPSAFQEMDEERKRFLESVLKSMTMDVVEEFQNALEILESQESSVDERLGALGAIEDFVDHIDQANNFVKIGGTRVIFPCLNSESAEIRKAAANLISEMSQNNPFCQKHFLDMDVISKLIPLLNDEEQVACGSMYAISSLVRSFEPGLAAFIEVGGLECMLSCVQSDHDKVAIKAIFLISSLSSEFPAVRDEFIKLGAIEVLAKLLCPGSEYDVKQETILTSLVALVDCPEGERRWRSVEARKVLQEFVGKCSDNPSCEEMIQYSNSLLKLCSDKSEDSAER